MEKGEQRTHKANNARFQKNITTITLITFILFSLIFIISAQETQAQSAQCCVTDDFCYDLTTNPDLDCDSLDGTESPQACADIPQCNLGCCCPNVGDPEITTRNACSGTFDGNIGNEATCAQFCNQNLVIITGLVEYSDGKPADATVTFFSSGDLDTTINEATVTDEEGKFSILLPADRTYQVAAHKNSDDGECVSQTKQITPTQSQDIGLFELPCTDVTTCLVTYDIGPWEDQQNNCGHRTVIKSNDCDSGVPPPPIDYVPCIDSGDFQCNPDGILDEGEQCDPGVQEGTSLFITQSDSCSSYSTEYSTGTLSCTQECLISTDNCVTCPQTTQGCTNIAQCGCAICQSVNLCSYTCNPEEAQLTLTAQRIYKTNEIEISWDWGSSLNCQQQVISQSLTRCKADEGTDECSETPIQISTQINPPYIDTNPYQTVDSTYCYNLTAEIQSPTGTYKINSNQVCVDAPDIECINREEGEFCLNGDIAYCDENGNLEEKNECQPDKTCAGPDINGNAYCINVDLCEACNGPFGLMGYDIFTRNLPLPENIRIESNGERCDQGFMKDQNYCYLDEASLAETAIGEYKACNTVTSCYDYMTLDSCNTNPCDAKLAEECAWHPLDDLGELGIGICAPENPEEQDCRQCDEKSPIGTCTQEVCSLFGSEDKCYYNEKQNALSFANDNSSCINIEDVGCETYDTEEQCAPNGPFVADITHDAGVQGTHKITKYSDDAKERGTCYWYSYENICLKDADMSLRDDGTGYGYDCGTEDLECLKDHEPPTTNISLKEGELYSVTELMKMEIVVTDNTYKQSEQTQDIETFFSITQGNPAQIKHPESEDLEDLEKEITTPGTHTLFYYSKDKSQNYEEVKRKTFTIINDITDLKEFVETKIDSAYAGNNGPDIFLSNLTMTINYPTSLTCKAQLTKDNQETQPYGGDTTKTGDPIIFKYTQLTDGAYKLILECKDEHLQTQTYETTIIIDADTNIKDVNPRKETFTPQELTISLSTSEDQNAKCYYNTDPKYQPPIDPFSKTIDDTWTLFEDTGEYYHQESNNYSEHKTYYYFTACRFNYTETNPSDFIGNWGDLIFFAIDSQPPDLEILDSTTGNPYDPTTPNSSVELEFKCTDKTEELRLTDEEYLDFGCSSLRYCIYTNKDEGCTPSIPMEEDEMPWTQTFNAITGLNKVYLNISVADKGGNIAIYDDVLLNLKNTTFLPPDIEIIE